MFTTEWFNVKEWQPHKLYIHELAYIPIWLIECFERFWVFVNKISPPKYGKWFTVAVASLKHIGHTITYCLFESRLYGYLPYWVSSWKEPMGFVSGDIPQQLCRTGRLSLSPEKKLKWGKQFLFHLNLLIFFSKIILMESETTPLLSSIVRSVIETCDWQKSY